jgi:DNA-3-methyladenine glycosylase I
MDVEGCFLFTDRGNLHADAMERGAVPGPDGRLRCAWGGTWQDDVYRAYHDEEWGVPIRADPSLFEHLCLSGTQAGLSWATILRRRAGYRQAFARFDPARVARFGDPDVERLVSDAGIIRNRAKIKAVVVNARAVEALRASGLELADHLWSFVDGRTVVNHWRTEDQLPASTAVSEAMAQDLKGRGFAFVGPTICYAFMQSAGLVNDHLIDCYRWAELSAPRNPDLEVRP